LGAAIIGENFAVEDRARPLFSDRIYATFTSKYATFTSKREHSDDE